MIVLFELTVVNQWHSKKFISILSLRNIFCSLGFGFCSCYNEMGTSIFYCFSSMCGDCRTEVMPLMRNFMFFFVVSYSIFTAFVIDSFLSQYILSETKEFPWTHQEEIITKRLTDKGYRVFRR